MSSQLVIFKPRRRARSLALAGAATLALAAGCGGGNGGDRLAQEELIEQGDAICTEYEAQIDGIPEPAGLEDIGPYVQETRPIIQEGTDRLADLEPPEELQDEYDEWIAQTRTGIEMIDDLEEAAMSGDEERIQEIIEGGSDSVEEANRIAREIGFEQCGDGS